MGIGHRIRQAREEQKGLTQSDIALVCKVTRNAVSLWESEAHAPTIDKIEPLARILKVNGEWLLTEQGLKYPEENTAELMLALDILRRLSPEDIKRWSAR